MSVLVDTSIWVDYFRTGGHSSNLDSLIDHNQIITNDLILAELIPFLKIRKQTALIALLTKVEKSEMSIDWKNIIELQTKCLKNGVNHVGIPDLLIAQHAIDKYLKVYALDKHFKRISDLTSLQLYP